MFHVKKTALVAAVAVSFGATAHAEEASYVLATASTGGTYYPVGVALSTRGFNSPVQHAGYGLGIAGLAS